MRVKLLVLMFVTVLAAVTLTADSGDAISADGGDIQVTPIMRTGVQIEYAGKVIQVNPLSKYDGKEIEYVGKFDALKPADLILVSDVGVDNFDVDEIVKIRKPGAPVVMPAAAGSQAGSKIAAPHLNAMLRSQAFLNQFLPVDRIALVPAYLPDFALTQPGYHDGGLGHRILYTGAMPSIHGNAMATPVPRRKVRRDNGLNIASTSNP